MTKIWLPASCRVRADIKACRGKAALRSVFVVFLFFFIRAFTWCIFLRVHCAFVNQGKPGSRGEKVRIMVTNKNKTVVFCPWWPALLSCAYVLAPAVNYCMLFGQGDRGECGMPGGKGDRVSARLLTHTLHRMSVCSPSTGQLLASFWYTSSVWFVPHRVLKVQWASVETEECRFVVYMLLSSLLPAYFITDLHYILQIIYE